MSDRFVEIVKEKMAQIKKQRESDSNREPEPVPTPEFTITREAPKPADPHAPTKH